MKILVTGLRGFPGVQGGIEAHCENLYPILVELGCDVEVVVRKKYLQHYVNDSYKNVKLTRLPSTTVSGLEALLHTFLSVLYAGMKRPDILHIHGIGPSLFVPLARLFGLKVVITHHGFDYNRKKWGRFARYILRAGEYFGVHFADEVIVVAKYIDDTIQERMERKCIVIPNGVNIVPLTNDRTVVDKLDLHSKKYILCVGRLVPEKGQLQLIEAFNKANIPNWKLVIVGGLKPGTDYIKSVQEASKDNPDIVLTGFLSGDFLTQIYSHAGMFVIPSSHEGLPIVLLEALSYGLPVLASDIPAHKSIDIDEDDYFVLDDIDELSRKMQVLSNRLLDVARRERQIQMISAEYKWVTVAKKTHDIYKSIM